LAEVADSGGCAWCHATKDSHSLEEAEAKISPSYRRWATAVGTAAALGAAGTAILTRRLETPDAKQKGPPAKGTPDSNQKPAPVEDAPGATRGGKKGGGRKLAPEQETKPTGAPYSKADAGELVDASQGRPGPGSNVGHARDHVPSEGQNPEQLAQARPKKSRTTVYRNERQAYQDLRDAMNDKHAEIAALPADGTTTAGGEHTTSKPRLGHESARGGAPQEVTFEKISWRVVRLKSGEIHIVHFAPKR
jgi:hypothetical protein